MSQLRHEWESCTGDKYCDECPFLKSGLADHRSFVRKFLSYVSEEIEFKQIRHQWEQARKYQQHCSKHQILFYLGNNRTADLVRKGKCLREPFKGNFKSVYVVGRQTVVGHKKLDPSGTAVRKISVSLVPLGLIGAGVKE